MKNTVNKSHMDTEKVAIVFGDCTLGVKSGNTHYIFLIQEADWNRSIKRKRMAIPGNTSSFWRATTDNDRVADLVFNPVCG